MNDDQFEDALRRTHIAKHRAARGVQHGYVRCRDCADARVERINEQHRTGFTPVNEPPNQPEGETP